MDMKTVLILAKSDKRGGYCMAGREVVEKHGKCCLGQWVRLVSNDLNSDRALQPFFLKQVNATQVRVMDIVKIAVDQSLPEPGQPENVLVNSQVAWEVTGHVNPANALGFVETPDDLWYRLHARSDVLPASHDGVDLVSQSLYLIQPENLRFRLSHEWDSYNGYFKRRIHAVFDYREASYCFSVTDPKMKRLFSRAYPGEGMPAQEVYLNGCVDPVLCVSLGPRFGYSQHHYKLVATVFDFSDPR